MSRNAKLMCGIILLTVPSIEFGGYFLLQILSGNMDALNLTGFQTAMFRAGHAHAGVLVMLSIVCQIVADHAKLPGGMQWFVRGGFPTAALLVSGGFFFSAMGEGLTSPTSLVALIYVGIGLLALSLIALGVGLLRNL